MIIQNPDPEKHEVHDYDITLSNGFLLQVTVDETLGDSIEFGSTTTHIHLSAKPSRINPKETLGKEDISVFNQHIIVVNHKCRMVTPPSVEDKDNWLDAFKEAGSTIQ